MYIKGILKYKRELKVNNKKEMPQQYDSLSEGKRKNCNEMYPDYQVYRCRNV